MNTQVKKSSPQLNKGAVAKISVLTFAVMNITTVLSTRGLAPEAEYGLTSIFITYLRQCAF
ncbi:hypothetical protein [Vibrio taketomensis]|uniref:hypothetical protein n=1 Tax=Vibrio taketomensis TaxID=2572923 RepID=UPI0018D803E1|nr:hypothetical protein [Vibrio taketomensis]